MSYQNGDPVEVLLTASDGTPRWVRGTHRGTLTEGSPGQPHLVSVDGCVLRQLYGTLFVWGQDVRSTLLHFREDAVRPAHGGVKES